MPGNWLRDLWYFSKHEDNRDFALEVFKTLGIGLTGLALFWSVWEGWEDRRLTQERLITERFSKAVELLKEERLTVRIGGIYALERIAKDSKKDYWTIMDVLTFYVREEYPYPEQETESAENELEIDLQAVITAIGRRENPPPERRNLIDSAIEKGKNLVFSKEPELKDTTDAGVKSEESEPGGIEDQDREYKGSPYFINLSATNLEGADFYNANLEGADFYNANLERTNFYNANLEGAYFRGANLEGADFWEAELEEADFAFAELEETDFIGAELEETNFAFAEFEEANFYNANLEGADFTFAELEGADFWEANLEGANFNGAELEGANFEGANFEGVYLVNTRNLTARQIKTACFWDKANYRGEWKWNENKEVFVPIEPDNTQYIEKLENDKESDPEEPVDCSRWE